MAKKPEFFQDGPQLQNQYDDDQMLQDHLQRVLPPEVFRAIEPGLRRMGERAVSDILALGDRAESTPPRLVQIAPWGRRIDVIEVSDAWQKLGHIATLEKLVRKAYERRFGEHSRIEQFALAYLFSASSAVYSCPLAMSDGAARALELHGDETNTVTENAFQRLVSDDPLLAWTSCQLMTEHIGGSDVSQSETVAIKDGDGYRLYGRKFFASAATSQMAMTLARIEGAPEGNRGLSMFYFETHNADELWNGITVDRLKDKLGTKAVPTAELNLNGTRAILIGEPGEGVRQITAILNITRVWNAVEAVSLMRRSIALARDYASRRKVFGELLKEKALHQVTLASLDTELCGSFALTFRVVGLLGKEETDSATQEELSLLRLLTPVAKLFTAKQAVAVVSEALECFGGAGYMEDTGLPRLLRDAQVLSTWEGTTNVLSLDVLRVITKTDALECFVRDTKKRLSNISQSESRTLVPVVLEALRLLTEHCAAIRNSSQEYKEANARGIAFGIAHIAVAALLIEEAEWAIQNTRPGLSLIAAFNWCATPLFIPRFPSLIDARLLALRGQ